MQGQRRLGALGAAAAIALVGLPGTALGEGADVVPDQVIVQFDNGATAAERADARADSETSTLEGLGAPGQKLLAIEDGASITATIRELEGDPAVESAVPNGIDRLAAVPNDTRFGELWGLHNTGQTVEGVPGTGDSDIDAPEAWDIERGTTNTVIAIMDSGIDQTHPDLAPLLWQNPGEVAGNGADDDANGFVDDVSGYDFVGTEDPNPHDDTGHGTHVAGTAAAAGDDGLGVSGVSQRASIMVLRVCKIDAGCVVSDQIEAINYAGNNGAHVLNGSLGGFSNDENPVRRTAIFSHPSTLFVWAAGNDGANADGAPAECNDSGTDPDPCRAYPCAHAPTANEVDNTLCVAATGQNDVRAGFSNFGSTSVDLGAPGVNVLSTSAERQYFIDPFTVDDFAARWVPNPGDDQNWDRITTSPFSAANPGITDSPGAPYLADREYGTLSNGVPVGAVSARGCDIRLQRLIDLSTNDEFRVGLRFNGAAADAESLFTQASNSTDFITSTLEFDAPSAAGTLAIRLRVDSDPPDEAAGVFVDNVILICAETPGPHDFIFKDGTSMASPHVAGAAGLILSRNSELTTTQLRNLILGSVDAVPTLSGLTTTGGRLNVGSAIARTPATTAISSGPAEGDEVGASARRGVFGAELGAKPNFSFTSSDPQATFECAIDSDPFAACSNPFETRPLGPGPHTLAVRSVDPRGNRDATPATRTFSVEGDPPETRITKAPKRRTDALKAKFKFKSDEPGSTFECKLDKKRFKPCSSPRKLKKVKPKGHKFLVRAIDPVGNVDSSAAKKRWRVSK